MSVAARSRVARVVVLAAIAFVGLDLVYSTVNDITYLTREKCILYRNLPKPLFLAFEYIVEMGAIVVVGIFLARLLERGFERYRRLYPRHPATAFLYASAIPVCACGAVPLLRSLRGKVPFRTVVTFVVAAPLMSPYILVLSLSVLGPTYALLRFGSALVLSVSAGYVLERFAGGVSETPEQMMPCGRSCCPLLPSDVYEDTYSLFKRVLPYLLLAGAGGILFELTAPAHLLRGLRASENPLGVLGVILVGVPLYFCNGSEVLLLRPLIHHGGFSMGPSVAFSMTSTAICITSFIMILKFLGARLTLLLALHIILVSLAISYLIDLACHTPALP